MADEQTPVEQVNSQQQATYAATQVAPDLEWEKRYKGMVPKVEELTKQVRDLQTQLQTKTSETERLSADLGLKDVEKASITDEMKRKYEELFTNNNQATSELRELRALKDKMDLVKEIGDPRLYKVIEKLPHSEDKEIMRNLFMDFSGIFEEAAKEREKQILAGVTPPTASTQAETVIAPSSPEEWTKHINSFIPGSPEKQKAMDSYWRWGESQT